jgi:Ni,Fe-hydrogenase I large subunit
MHITTCDICGNKINSLHDIHIRHILKSYDLCETCATPVLDLLKNIEK